MKRLMSMILAVLLIAACAVSASAASVDPAETGKTIITDNDWVYEIIDNGTHWELDAYTGSGGIVVAPRYLYDMRIVAIGDHCFANNSTVTSLLTSSPLWAIGENAFANCTSIEKIELNFALHTIGLGAFSGTSSLKDINLEEAIVTEIRPYTFLNSGIEEITLPDTCTKLDSYSFAQCYQLTKITIPASVTEIADTAFDRNENMTIYCYTDSAAHEYALAKNIPFVLLDGPVEVTFLLGDADGSGEVTILDATKIQRVLVDLDPDPDGMIAMRGHTYGEDDELNIMDATVIQRYLAGFAVSDDFNTEVTRTITPSGV